MHQLAKLLMISLSSLSLFIAGPAMAQCQDDERLFSIGNFLAEQAEGNAAPLLLTAKTFLELTPAARQAIGDNLRILNNDCQPVQVLKGAPPAKIDLPLPVIYNAFHDAVLRGDTTTQRLMLQSFKASDVDASEFLGFFAPLNVSQEVLAQIANAAGIRVNQSHPISPFKADTRYACENANPNYLSFADIFNRFGGKVTGKHGTAWFAITEREVVAVENQAVARIMLQGDCISGPATLAARIVAAGGLPVYLDTNTWRASDRVEGLLLSSYEAWVENRAPAPAPMSLFD